MSKNLYINEKELLSLIQNTGVDYEMKLNDNDLVSDAIFNYLFSNKNGIQKNKIENIPDKILEFYKRNIKKQVNEGKPIEFFLNYFTPKFKYDHLNGLNIYPDIIDLTTIIHLQKVAKEIRKIYPYNIKFIIVFSGDLFKYIGMWSSYELTKTREILNKMIKYSEQVVDNIGSIELTRMKYFLDEKRDSFEDVLHRQAEEVYSNFKTKNSQDKYEVTKWLDWFTEHFRNSYNDPFFIEFFEKQASKIVAFEKILYDDGGFLNILNRGNKGKERFLAAQTTKESRFYSLNLDFFADRYNYFRVIARKDKKWLVTEWNEIKPFDPLPVFFDKFEFPLFFKI